MIISRIMYSFQCILECFLQLRTSEKVANKTLCTCRICSAHWRRVQLFTISIPILSPHQQDSMILSLIVSCRFRKPGSSTTTCSSVLLYGILAPSRPRLSHMLIVIFEVKFWQTLDVFFGIRQWICKPYEGSHNSVLPASFTATAVVPVEFRCIPNSMYSAPSPAWTSDTYPHYHHEKYVIRKMFGWNLSNSQRRRLYRLWLRVRRIRLRPTGELRTRLQNGLASTNDVWRDNPRALGNGCTRRSYAGIRHIIRCEALCSREIITPARREMLQEHFTPRVGTSASENALACSADGISHLCDKFESGRASRVRALYYGWIDPLVQIP